MTYTHFDHEISGQQYEIRRQKKIEMLKDIGAVALCGVFGFLLVLFAIALQK
jgi:hypothetical protein